MDKHILLLGVAFPNQREATWWKNKQFLIPSVTFSQCVLLDSLKINVYFVPCERFACSRLSVPTCHGNSAQINHLPMETPWMARSLAFQSFWKWATIRLDDSVNTLNLKTLGINTFILNIVEWQSWLTQLQGKKNMVYLHLDYAPSKDSWLIRFLPPTKQILSSN